MGLGGWYLVGLTDRILSYTECIHDLMTEIIETLPTYVLPVGSVYNGDIITAIIFIDMLFQKMRICDKIIHAL